MPFRKNHSRYVPCGLFDPNVNHVVMHDNKPVCEKVDCFAPLPDPEDFSPEVLVKSGVPASSVGTILFRPSKTEYSALADSISSSEVPPEVPSESSVSNDNKE